jgi:hypothetical protein
MPMTRRATSLGWDWWRMVGWPGDLASWWRGHRVQSLWLGRQGRGNEVVEVGVVALEEGEVELLGELAGLGDSGEEGGDVGLGEGHPLDFAGVHDDGAGEAGFSTPVGDVEAAEEGDLDSADEHGETERDGGVAAEVDGEGVAMLGALDGFGRADGLDGDPLTRGGQVGVPVRHGREGSVHGEG